jgi:hypothetical protein
MNKTRIYTLICIILIISSSIAYAQEFGTSYSNNPREPYGPTTGNIFNQWSNKESLSDWWESTTRGISSQILGGQQDIGESIIVNVKDYEPKIVGQSILEQNDVPVFITLTGTTFGTILSPFTSDITQEDILTGIKNIPPIRRIEVNKLGSNEKIKDIRYYPPRDNAYSLTNLGYLKVTLKKLKNESELKDSTLSANLTAKIYLDLNDRGLFNIGPETLILSSEPDEKLYLNKINKDENAFLSRKGYIRAIAIDKDQASFIIYDNSERPLSSLMPAQYVKPYNPIKTLRLSEGEQESFRVGLTGDPFQDYITIRLDSIVSADDRAVFEFDVNGHKEKRIVMKNKALYPESNWKLSGIAKTNLGLKTKDELISKYGISQTLLENLPATNGMYNLIEHKAYIENYNTNQRKTIIRYIIDEATIKIEIKDITNEAAKILENRYCDPIKLANPLMTNKTKYNYGCQAMVRLKTFTEKYPDLQETGLAYKNLGEIYNDYLIDWPACDIMNTELKLRDEVNCNEYKRDMDILAYHYYKIIESKFPQLLLDYKEKSKGSGGEDYLEDERIALALKYVEPLAEVDKGSFKYRINSGVESEETHVNEIIKDEGGIPFIGKDNNEEFSWKVTEIYPKYVKVRQVFKEKEKLLGKEKSLYFNKADKLPIEITKESLLPSEEKSSVNIEILSIDTKTQAVVTISPGQGEAISTSNFSIHIPIEKRPWKFTPEQIQAQINAVNKVVEKLDSIITKFETMVKTWKKVCILTFTALTIKNSLFSGGARVMARQTVAQYYKNQCVEEANKYANIDECLYEKSKEISDMTDLEEKAIKKANEAVKGQTTESLQNSKDEKTAIAGKMQVPITDYREHIRLQELKTIVKDKKYLKYIEERSSELGYYKKIQAYKQAQTAFNKSTESQKKDYIKQFGKSNEQQAIVSLAQGYLQSADLIKTPDNIETLYSINEAPDQKKALAAIPKINNKKDLEDFIQLKLVRISQLEYDIKQAGGMEKFKENLQKEINAKFKEPPVKPTIKEYINSKYPTIDEPASVNGKPIYVEDKKYTEESIKNYQVKIDIEQLYTSPYASIGTLRLRNTYSNIYYNNGFIDAEYRADGFVYCVPTGENGNYIYVKERYETGEPRNFEIRNIGPNGLIECNSQSDDVIIPGGTWDALQANQLMQNKYKAILQRFDICKKDDDIINTNLIKGIKIKCSSKGKTFADDIKAPKCIDTMDPADCKLLFNACDPVMCPTSRCNLGGKYKPANVIQTGIIGSVVLCAPNIKQGIVMPVCLTGILAGLKNLRAFIKGYADCLDVSLKKGENIGLCSYIRSVGICELVWREVISIVQMRGGLIDLFSGKLSSATTGGGEYLTFKESLDNIGDSFNYFTTDYQNTFLAYYKGKSTQEIGSQICRLQVAGKLPSFGEVLDKLSEPENPPQYTAFFDTAPWMETIGETPGVSLTQYGTKELNKYRVFYNIYAGSGFAEQQGVLPSLGSESMLQDKVSYMVYLKGSGLPPLYVTSTDNWGVSRKVLNKGESAIETIEKIGPKGYTEICIVLSNQPEQCGFGKVSSTFSINWLNNELVSSDATSPITTKEQCSPEYPRTPVSLGSVPIPENYGMISTGIIRVCNPVLPPTNDYNRWKKVGVCGKDSNGKDLGDCWIDMNSISISDVKLKQEVYNELSKMDSGLVKGELITSEQAAVILKLLNKERDRIMQELINLVEQNKLTNRDRLEILKKSWKTIPIQAEKQTSTSPKLTQPLAINNINIPTEIYNLISKVSEEESIDPLLVTAIISIECTTFKNEECINKNSKACGLMQLTPITIKDINSRPEIYENKLKGKEKNLCDNKENNIRAGILVFKVWLNKCTENAKDEDILQCTLASYNAGFNNRNGKNAENYAKDVMKNYNELKTKTNRAGSPTTPTTSAQTQTNIHNVPHGAKECENGFQNQIIKGNNEPTKSTIENWEDALNNNNIKGTTWIGKLDSNGPEDDYEREEKGRDTIIFAPCTTDFTKPIEIAYFFHGDHGFCGPKSNGKCGEHDMKLRVIAQAKTMSEQKRNFVIVYPEMPWSAGNGKYNNKNNDRAYTKQGIIQPAKTRKGMIWNNGDSNPYQLHKDVLNILKTKFNNDKDTNVGYISLTGHSAGGAALSYAARKPIANNNYLKQIQSNKIVFSDADYNWGGTSGAVSVYENYLKDNNAIMYMIVQDPSNNDAHTPTQAAINFVNKYGRLNWELKNTNGATKNKEFTVPNTNNKVYYIPINKDHITIGRLSMAWLPTISIQVSENKEYYDEELIAVYEQPDDESAIA